ncbi:MAG: hypothetical protein ACRCZF_01325, partial [Gemmataceae bacterium]
AAVLGQAGYQSVLNNPEVGRGVKPLQYAPVLATMTPPRQYDALVAKNFFHGSLPPPKPIVIEDEKPTAAVAPPKPKEDISPFLRMTGLVREPDGKTITADIWDKANNQTYQIELVARGEKYDVKVEKFYYLKDRQKRLDRWTELVISEENTATNRTFKVVGVDGDGLVLTEATTAPQEKSEKSEKPEKPEKKTTDGPRRGSEKSNKPKEKEDLPPADPSAVLAGGGVAGLPVNGERVFHWRVGQSLKSLTEMSGGEARALIERAYPPVK